MAERLQRITSSTVIPLGIMATLVVMACSVTWFLASDRTATLGRVTRNTDDIAELKAEMVHVSAGMNRVAEGVGRIEDTLGELADGRRGQGSEGPRVGP